jgi:hypothetical protein
VAFSIDLTTSMSVCKEQGITEAAETLKLPISYKNTIA